MVLFRVAAAVYNLAILLVPAAAPVLLLTTMTTISQLTPHASRRVVGQWGGAGGAIYEEHFACGASRALRGGLTRLEKPEIFNSQLTKQTLITDPA